MKKTRILQTVGLFLMFSICAMAQLPSAGGGNPIINLIQSADSTGITAANSLGFLFVLAGLVTWAVTKRMSLGVAGVLIGCAIAKANYIYTSFQTWL